MDEALRPDTEKITNNMITFIKKLTYLIKLANVGV